MTSGLHRNVNTNNNLDLCTRKFFYASIQKYD